jgi:hypothetical protein
MIDCPTMVSVCAILVPALSLSPGFMYSGEKNSSEARGSGRGSVVGAKHKQEAESMRLRRLLYSSYSRARRHSYVREDQSRVKRSLSFVSSLAPQSSFRTIAK